MDPTRSDILDVSDLWVGFPSYGAATHHALKGIDLRIAPGELVGLVGESGSGKTTLARAIMGLVPPPGVIERGGVLFGGRDLGRLDDDARRSVLGRDLAMVIPNPRAELNPVISVGRQISNMAFHHLGVDRAEADRRMAAARTLESGVRAKVDGRLTAFAESLPPEERKVLAEGLRRVYAPRQKPRDARADERPRRKNPDAP
jgi:ABC-type glutathione transport system ATPase component